MSDLLKVKTGSDIDSDCSSNEASTQWLDPDSDDVIEISDKIEHLSTRVEFSTAHNTYTTHTALNFLTLFFKYNTHVTQLCIHMFTQVHTC